MPSFSKNVLLWLLVFSQFAGTSLWFVGNAIIDSLPSTSPDSYANLTSVVQFGFIGGTFLFSLFGIADRISPALVFFFSSIIAALANLLIIWLGNDLFVVLILRFITGFFLAGIYPVGMKIAADYFPERLGKALGFLVGALVLGTAFPHLVRSQTHSVGWKGIIATASVLAVVGGCVIFFAFPKTKNANPPQSFHPLTAMKTFRSGPFRSAAFGYFGHMWELYALWAVLPALFSAYNQQNAVHFSVYFLSFAVIAAGGIGCVAGGLLSQKWGSKKVAFYSLLLSGCCSLLAPLFFQSTALLFLSLMLIWGITVTADSPQFSALIARFAKTENKGTALTLVTCIGFSITIASIQLIKHLFQHHQAQSLWLLSAGPLLGLMALKRPD
ncbi:MFS transporter [Flavisolibacter ginsenosidimutans]|uniref:MFS transporter n=1 Tax=Flavisolibacter ginsenosidimutans TaxID=661481 RepID=A0A5B8UEV2_9BACT|nr:MFS transporter [Flavisolibacter ginsenosidimutans]QEC55094.1 MFS transporter [Flavisolibacter ginsenosidimutans]